MSQKHGLWVYVESVDGIMLRGRWPVGLTGTLVSLLIGASTALAQPEPFSGHLLGGSDARLTCEALGDSSNRVRFCRGGVEGNPFAPGGTYDKRVVSWDGQPIDADVTLPPEGEGPWPLVVMLHGYPGNKTNLESQDSSSREGFNNVNLAGRGFAVLNHSARGLGASCGPSLGYLGSGYGFEDYLFGDVACNARYIFSFRGGWLHLADARYEARDTQTLAGYLVESGIANPGIGVIGESYGGGQTLILSQLNDRIMREDGTFRTWTHNGTTIGTPMQVAAAASLVGWSDLGNSLMPNGQPLDFRPVGQTTSPIGVKKESLMDGFYLAGLLTGNYAPLWCLGPAYGQPNCPDITNWYWRMGQGEPFNDEQSAALAEEMWNYHSALGLEPSSGGPAPTFIASGWTDDMFTPIEGIRMYNKSTSNYPDVPVAIDLADIGHERAQNKAEDQRAVADDVLAWLDRYVKGDDSAPVPTGVKAWTHTCPRTAPSRGPYTALSWRSLTRRGTYYRSSDVQTVDALGGRSDVALAIDPNPLNGQLGIGIPPDACRQTTTEQDPGVATYTLPSSRGFTMIGLPTIKASITTRGVGGNSPQDSDGQLTARLWDVDPDGENQTLVTKGVYRLQGNQSGVITLQLNGNAWYFARGHRPKIELLGRDDASEDFGIGSWRASNNRDFTVTINAVKVKLPTRYRRSIRRITGEIEKRR